MKDVKNDPDNPFGSLIKDADQGGQYWYDSKTGERISGATDNPNKKLGLINKGLMKEIGQNGKMHYHHSFCQNKVFH